MTQPTTDLARTKLDTESLREISSIEDAMAVLANAGIEIKSASEELGDGFTLLAEDDKASLIGVAFLIIECSLSDGDFGTFASLRLITRDGRKCILNDGSTGIRAQVVEYLDNHETIVGLAVEKGLRASDFRFCEDCKSVNRKNATKCKECESEKVRPARTYYLDTSRAA